MTSEAGKKGVVKVMSKMAFPRFKVPWAQIFEAMVSMRVRRCVFTKHAVTHQWNRVRRDCPGNHHASSHAFPEASGTPADLDWGDSTSGARMASTTCTTRNDPQAPVLDAYEQLQDIQRIHSADELDESELCTLRA